MKAVDRAWAAGFLDGEGTFTICRTDGAAQVASRRSVNAIVQATQVDPRPLRRLKTMFGGQTGGPYTRRSNRPSYFWRAEGVRTVLPLLVAIRPFLVVKDRQADLLLEYCRGVGAPQPGRKLTDEVRAARLIYPERASALNHAPTD